MRFALVSLWLALYSALAYGGDLAEGLQSISITNVLIAAGLSFVGGIAWTSQKEAASTSENKKLLLTIVSDISCSVVAGLITFFVLSIWTDSPLLQAALITIAGYGGTRILDGYVNVALERIKGLFGRSA